MVSLPTYRLLIEGEKENPYINEALMFNTRCRYIQTGLKKRVEIYRLKNIGLEPLSVLAPVGMDVVQKEK